MKTENSKVFYGAALSFIVSSGQMRRRNQRAFCRVPDKIGHAVVKAYIRRTVDAKFVSIAPLWSFCGLHSAPFA